MESLVFMVFLNHKLKHIFFYCSHRFFPLPFSPLIPPCPHHHHTVVHVHMSFSLFAQSLHPLTFPHLSCHPALYESVSILLLSSICSLDSTYEWNRMSFSDWFISLSIMFSRSIQAITKGKIFFSFLWPSSIPSCKCSIVILSTHLLMDTWAASIS